MSMIKDTNALKMDAQGQLSLMQAKRKMMLTNIDTGKEQLAHLKSTRDNLEAELAQIGQEFVNKKATHTLKATSLHTLR